MDKIKVFWVGKDDTTRMTSHSYYLREKLSKRVDVTPLWDVSKWHGIDKDILVHLDKLDEKPDLIYLSSPTMLWSNLDKVDIPKFYWWGDPHTLVDKRIEWFNKSKIDIALHCVFGDPDTHQFGFSKFIDKLWDGHKSAFMPWGVEIDVFKDYGLKKEYDFLIFGRDAKGWYPLRNRLAEWIRKSEYSYKEIRRPRMDRGWTKDRLEEEGLYMRDSLAKLLNQTRILATGTSTMVYPVAKLFETMACKCHLICNAPRPAHYYHLYWHNHSSINLGDFVEDHMDWMADYYLNKEPEVMEWKVDNAYKTVRQYHSIDRRVDKLLEYYEGLDEDGNRLWY